MDASSFADSRLWAGGFYELALELGERDDVRLDAVLRSIWGGPGLHGSYLSRLEPRATQQRIEGSLAQLEHSGGHLSGVATVAGGRDLVCGVCVIRETDGPDWVVLYLPLGALGLVERRVGGFPFAPDYCGSLAWRRSIDDWLFSVGRHVYTLCRFKLGLIGFEASCEDYASDIQMSPPSERYEAYLIPAEGGLTYHPATV